MLSSYQEAAQAVEGGDESCLVPFWRFFDTLEKELDHGIKQVFVRCRDAAERDYTIQPQDIDVLKVLYLINYINDVKPCIGNIAILMADRIDVDMKAKKEVVKESLNRLVRENYVARTGDRYAFLTDIEQEVAREIKDEKIDPANVIDEVQKIIFSKIFTDKRFRKGANDFPIDRYIDDTIVGQSQQGMRLNVITLANTALAEASDGELDLKSTEQALLVLDTESDYYNILYNAAKIKKYAQTKISSDNSQAKKSIIQRKQEEAVENRKEAESLIEDAIVHARVSVAGQSVQVPAGTAKQKIEGVLDKLASAIFTKATLIDSPIDNDAQLRNVLTGHYQQMSTDGEPGGNAEAVKAMLTYLQARGKTYQATTVGDLQRNFQGKPYGWREIDVASVAAKLINGQQATVSYGGARVLASDPKMLAYLRKQSEIDKATIAIRKSIPSVLVSKAKEVLRELDSAANPPADEDGLVQAVKDCLGNRVSTLQDMLASKYRGMKSYPGRATIEKGIHLASSVLSQKADPEALLSELRNLSEDIMDNEEDLGEVRKFFETNQKELFDKALKTLDTMKSESAYVEGDVDVQSALADLRAIVNNEKPYGKIKDLGGLTDKAMKSYWKLCAAKRNDMLGRLDSAFDEIESYAKSEGTPAAGACAMIVTTAGESRIQKRSSIHDAETCSRLDAIGAQIDAWRDSQLMMIDGAVRDARRPQPKPGSGPIAPSTPPKPASKPKVVQRSSVLPPKVLHNENDIDEYLAQLKVRLLKELEGFDSIRLG